MGRDPDLLVILARGDVAPYRADRTRSRFPWTHIMYLGTEALPVPD